jgi:hypothetical protein
MDIGSGPETPVREFDEETMNFWPYQLPTPLVGGKGPLPTFLTDDLFAVDSDGIFLNTPPSQPGVCIEVVLEVNHWIHSCVFDLHLYRFHGTTVVNSTMETQCGEELAFKVES